jgi:radical SAM superfamily enzyme YgiQ (UPF0313 family)
MTRILLINPYPDRASGINDSTITPPLGLAYLAAVLLREGFSVRIIDANILSIPNEELLEEIRRENPAILGISLNIITAEPGCRLARAAKSAGLGAKVVLGGVTPTTDPAGTMRKAVADFAVVGEGEQTMLELARAIRAGSGDFSSIKGLAYRAGGEIVVCPPRERLTDLDSLPFPAFELLPPFRLYRSRARGSPAASVFTSRGCPFMCTFCNKSVFGNQTTLHSAGRVLDEIGFLVGRYGVRQIDVLDDHFTFDRDRAAAILDGIVQRGYKVFINLQNGVRADRVDEELIRKMRAAGVYKIGFGVESGDPVVLKRNRKALDLEKVLEASALAKKHGLLVYGFFILGLPGDSPASMERTISFALKMDPSVANFGIALPFPGTEMFEMVRREGRFLYDLGTDCFSGYNSGRAFFEMDGLTAADVEKAYKDAYTRFYMRPGKVLEVLLSTRSLTELKWTVHAAMASQGFRFTRGR